MSGTLSAKDQATINALRTFRDQHGHAPSLRELMPLLGVQSTSAVDYRLGRLRERGLVQHVPGRARTLRLLL